LFVFTHTLFFWKPPTLPTPLPLLLNKISNQKKIGSQHSLLQKWVDCFSFKRKKGVFTYPKKVSKIITTTITTTKKRFPFLLKKEKIKYQPKKKDSWTWLKLFETFLDKRNKKRLLQNKILIEEKKWQETRKKNIW